MSTPIGKGTDDDGNINDVVKKDKLSETQTTAKNSTNDSFRDHNNNESDSSDVAKHHHHGHVQLRSGLGWGKGIKQDVQRTLLTHWKREMINLNSKVCLFWCI